ncbi:BMP-binding endothelial regulator protein [Aphelenchoides fujianensis]|nr:BMP-binding endothelial regulator protein [Aphelenchoides fujianensis]
MDWDKPETDMWIEARGGTGLSEKRLLPSRLGIESFEFPMDTKCYRLACALLNCPFAEQIRPPWSCCPQCSRQKRQLESFFDSKSINTEAVFCDFNGRILGAGERFRPDVCTQCTCGKDGRMVCHGAVYRPQVCCPYSGELRKFQQRARISTPFGGFSPLTHDLDFASNDHALIHPTLLPGRQCVIQLNSAQIVWKENDRWSPDACTTCACRSGQVVCQSRACPPLRCDPDSQEETIPKGKCCPICVEDCKEHPSFTLELHNDQEGGVRKSSVELNENNGIRLGVLNFFSKELKYRGRRIKLPLKTRILRAFRSAAANRTTLDLHLVGLKVVWTAGRSVRVFVERKRHFGNLCGLCGNFNDQPADDLLPQFATNVTNDEREFVDSWRCSRLLSPWNRTERRGFLTQFLKLKRNPLLQSCHSVLGFHSFLRRFTAAVCRCEHDRQAGGRPTKMEETLRRRRRKFVKKRRSPIDSIVIKMKGGRVQKTLRYPTKAASEKLPEEPCFCSAMSGYVRKCAQRGLLTFGLSNPRVEKTGLVAGRLRFHSDCPPVKLERV